MADEALAVQARRGQGLAHVVTSEPKPGQDVRVLCRSYRGAELTFMGPIPIEKVTCPRCYAQMLASPQRVRNAVRKYRSRYQ